MSALRRTRILMMMPRCGKALRVSVRGCVAGGLERIVGNGFNPKRHTFQFDIPIVTDAAYFGNALVRNSGRGDQNLFDRLLSDDPGKQSIAPKDAKAVNEFP